MLGIDDEWLAYQLDGLVCDIGSRPMTDERKRGSEDGEYRTLMGNRKVRRMSIPESGIW